MKKYKFIFRLLNDLNIWINTESVRLTKALIKLSCKSP